MKRAIRQEFPPGWNEKKVRAVIAHYDRQTEDEAAAEIEAACATWMAVPTELVGVVTRLIEDHAKNAAAAHSRNHKTKSTTRKARR